MPDKKKISELDSASVLNNGDLVVISQDNGDDSYSSKKAVLTMLGTKLLNGIDYTTLLDTTSKKPIGAINELRDLIIGQLPVVTESGSLATFTTPLALPLVSLKANITATQSGTGTPSPQNERPISGFSSVRLWQVSQYAEYFKGILTGTYGVFVFDGSEDENWNNVSASGNRANTIVIGSSVDQPQDLAIISNEFTGVSYNDRSGSNVNTCYVSPSGNLAVITTTEFDTAAKFKTYLASNNLIVIIKLATPTTPTITDAQFETLCQAFGISGDAITIALGDTYYGGVLDVKNGTATITHVKEILKWSEGGAVADLGTYTRKMFVSSTMANESLPQLCNVAPYAYNYSTDSLHFYCRAYTNDTRIYLFLDEDNLPADFDEFEVIYGLATPITLSGLTPDNFTTIAGQNNIFADSGDVELSFKQGIQEYIDEQIATTQALIL